MNPDGENLFLYPLLLLSSSPSGSDSGVRLCFLLALWFMVVMIYCVQAAWRQLQVPLLLLLPSPRFPLTLCMQALNLLSLCFCLWYNCKTDTAYQAHIGLKNWPSVSFTCDMRDTMHLLVVISDSMNKDAARQLKSIAKILFWQPASQTSLYISTQTHWSMPKLNFNCQLFACHHSLDLHLNLLTTIFCLYTLLNCTAIDHHHLQTSGIHY